MVHTLRFQLRFRSLTPGWRVPTFPVAGGAALVRPVSGAVGFPGEPPTYAGTRKTPADERIRRIMQLEEPGGIKDSGQFLQPVPRFRYTVAE